MYGKQHGKGQYVLIDGTIKKGEWVEGKKIRNLID